jgi:hypothetical protein
VGILTAVLRVNVGEQSGSVKVKVTCTKHIRSILLDSGISFSVSDEREVCTVVYVCHGGREEERGGGLIT